MKVNFGANCTFSWTSPPLFIDTDFSWSTLVSSNKTIAMSNEQEMTLCIFKIMHESYDSIYVQFSLYLF